MKVLVIGSGGREHSLCWAIAKSPECDELYCAPGNAGIDQVAITQPIAIDDLDGIMAFVQDNGGDFVVVGRDNDVIKQPRCLGRLDRPGDFRLAAEVLNVLARDTLAATAGWDNGDLHVWIAFFNAATTLFCCASVNPGYIGKLIASS